MIHLTKLRYSLILALGLLMMAPVGGPIGGLLGIVEAQAAVVNRIDVDGNSRVGDATVISYLTVRVGQNATAGDLTASTNALLSSGLFAEARVTMSGNTLRVSVTENGVIGSVLFEGNQRFSDQQLLDMIDLGSRGTFTQERLATDKQTIRLAYERAGFNDVVVDSRTATVNGRTQVVFEISEGGRVGVAAINFSGVNAFREDQLKSVIRTRESHFLSWLFKDDSYDEDKLAVDAELIRIFYANHGYPDAQVLSAVADFDDTKNAYFINFSISEGERYEFGNIGIETSIPGLDTDALKWFVRTDSGSRYSLQELQRSAEDIAVAATDQGFSFADVRPRLNRDIASKTFNVTYLVDEGARVYVERINITGNEKTRDFVIRRELPFAEGDPFNRTLVTRGKADIEALDYFETVDVSTSPGSAPDKVVINIAVNEKATGDYGATIGYDSASGLLGELSLTERNFLGRGQYLRVSLGASQSGRTYDFSFTEPRFMGLEISAGVDVYRRIVDETATNFYGINSTGGQLRFGVPLTRELDATVFTGYESNVYTDAKLASGAAGQDSNLIAGASQTRSQLFAGYTLKYSTLDDEKDPREGFYGTFTQTYAGLDDNYLKSEVRGRYFMPLMEDYNFIASLKGQAGIINDFSGTGVHPTESFFPGTQLVRGFQARGMGARGANGEPYGAIWYAGLSGEIEFPLPVPESYGLSAAIWGDIGFVGDPSAAAPAAASGMTQQLRSSVGASLIWDSPFGPLRGDFAQVLQKDSGDKTQFFALTISSLL